MARKQRRKTTNNTTNDANDQALASGESLANVPVTVMGNVQIYNEIIGYLC